MKKPKLSKIERLLAKAENKYDYGSYQEARDYCLRILELKPKHEEALSLLAYCYGELEEYQLAYDTYTRFIELEPWLGIDWFMYGWLCDKLNINNLAP